MNQIEVLAKLPTRLAALLITVTPTSSPKVNELHKLVGEIVRVTAGPIVIMASEYAADWCSAFARHNVGISRATYMDALDILTAQADTIELPTNADTLTDYIRIIVEQCAGTVIDPYASTFLTALPTIVTDKTRFVGIVNGEAHVQDTIISITNKLAGKDRVTEGIVKRKQLRKGMQA